MSPQEPATLGPLPSAASAPSIRPGSVRAWVSLAGPQPSPRRSSPSPSAARRPRRGSFRARRPFAALSALFLPDRHELRERRLRPRERRRHRGAPRPDARHRHGPAHAARGPRRPRRHRRPRPAPRPLPRSVGGWPIVAIGIGLDPRRHRVHRRTVSARLPRPRRRVRLLFFGLVAVCGTAFVQVGSVPPLAVLGAVPVGALATAILVVKTSATVRPT